jgi:hypothetical protein
VSYAAISEDRLRGGLSQAGLPSFVIDAVAEIERTFVQATRLVQTRTSDAYFLAAVE